MGYRGILKEARRSWSGLELGEGLVRGNYTCKGPVVEEYALLWRNNGKAGESVAQRIKRIG